MLKKIIQSGYISYASDANRIAYVLGHFPFIGDKINSARSGRREQRAFGIAGVVLRLIWEIIKKAAFVAVFMILPRYVLGRICATGDNGFGLKNCFVYFSVVMVCFCGSINNSAIFDVNEEAYAALREAKCSPYDYFRMVVLRKSITELISFWSVFTIFGMNFFKAFYLTIVIIGSRFAGEAFNILLFRATRKPFSAHKGAGIVLMLVSLFAAYFVPYLRGHVPGAYELIFDTIWLMVILTAFAVLIYYVWNYSGYPKIAARIFRKSALEDESGQEFISEVYDGPALSAEDIEEYNLESYKEINREFFARNRSAIAGAIEFRIVFSAAAFAAALIAVLNGYNDAVYKVISYSMSVMVFVMCVFSNSFRLCKAFFYQCDCELLKNESYRRRNDILENFFIRLKYLLVIDLIPAVFLSAAYAAAGMIAGKDGSGHIVAAVCIGIILLSCFFTVFQLGLYYIIQPYKSDIKKGNTVYTVINIGMYIACALFIYIDSTTVFFSFCAGLALAVVTAAAVTLVSQLGYKTFRLK